jgi:hypothetical protein
MKQIWGITKNINSWSWLLSMLIVAFKFW